ncbi:MAG: hypothetical protein ABW278_01660 [Steroidobacteraceae bacterium]
MNKQMMSILVAGTLAVTALPASAQLLGGGMGGALNGALGGQLGGQMSPGGGGMIGGSGDGRWGADPQLGGVREGLGRARTATGDATARGVETGKAKAGAAKDGVATAANSDRSLNASGGGAVEKQAAGRNVKAGGNTSQGVTRDATGLSLGSANNADASITKVEPAATDTAAAPAEGATQSAE